MVGKPLHWLEIKFSQYRQRFGGGRTSNKIKAMLNKLIIDEAKGKLEMEAKTQEHKTYLISLLNDHFTTNTHLLKRKVSKT